MTTPQYTEDDFAGFLEPFGDVPPLTPDQEAFPKDPNGYWSTEGDYYSRRELLDEG